MPEDVAKPESGTPEDGARRWRAILKRIGYVRLALAAALLVTLAVPATREMHILTFRLLFRIPGPNTNVQGQPEGCRILVIPNLEFHEEYEEVRQRESQLGPEEYLLALTCRRWRPPPVPPPVEKWRGEDDLLLLSALWGTEAVPFTTEKLDRRPVLALVKEAQDRFPTNGYLWLAEARLHHAQGDRGKALSALREAAKRPAGPMVTPASEDRAHEILVKAGLSHLDASLQAVYRRYGTSCVASGASGDIADQIADAISQDDRDRVLALLRVADQLRKARFRPSPALNPFDHTLTLNHEIGEAAAQQLGRKLPYCSPTADFSVEKYTANQEALRKATIDYLKLAAGEALAEELVMPHFADCSPEAKELRKQLMRASHESFQRAMRYFVAATLSGVAALLLLTSLVAFGLHEGAYALVPALQEHDDDWRVLRRPAALAAVLLAFLGCLMLFAASFNAWLQPIGMRALSAGTERSPFWDNVRLGLIVAAVWASVRFCRRRSAGIAYWASAALIGLYTGSVVSAAIFRLMLEEALLASV